MGKAERCRRWLAGMIWPEIAEQEKEIAELSMRLKDTHRRMQDLYWTGKAKEAAQARIAGLTEGLVRALSALYLTGEVPAALAFEDELHVGWSAEIAERWRKAEALPEVMEEEVERL